MYAINHKLQNIAILIDKQLKPFDVLIALILNYTCEVWVFENNEGDRKTALTVLQKHLGVRNNTPRYMAYGELGCFLMEIVIKLRMCTFWNNLVEDKNKLSSLIFRLMLKLQQSNQVHFK